MTPEQEHNKNQEQYSVSEKAVMVAALVLFLSMFYIYVADISLKHYFFSAFDDRIYLKPIGKIVEVSGTAARQKHSEFEFKNVEKSTELYLNDTVMTMADSQLILVLNDGQKFELNQNSLIKLTFQYDFSVGGFVPRAVVQILATPKPVAVESPIVRQVIVPLIFSNLNLKTEEKIRFSPADYLTGKKTVTVTFNANKPAKDLVFQLNGRPFTIVPKGSDGYLVGMELRSPGKYEWRLSDTENKVVQTGNILVEKEIEMIKTIETGGTNNRLEGLATKKKFSGFKLRWTPVDGVDLYQITVFAPGSNKVALTRKLKTTSLLLNKDNLLLGKMSYKVERPLKNGFLAVSSRDEFGFHFLPPEPGQPANRANLEKSHLSATFGTIIFTWSKTNYTDGYRLDLASDAEFQKIIFQKRLKDNFFSWRTPKNGTYYWRVLSIKDEVFSAPSQAYTFVISGF